MSAAATVPCVLHDRYDVLRPIGHGGQGTVFLANDRKSGSTVAVKRITTNYERNDDTIKLFQRECRVLASLRHPGIPSYIDEFEQAGCLYLVMEYVDGSTLSDLMNQRARFSEQDVRDLLGQMGRILSALHDLHPQVIHRDIKPQNIIRRPDGRYALVDFGLSRDRVVGSQLSFQIGTPGFAAPELMQGRAMPQTDVYSLGITVLAMLTGADPRDLAPNGGPIRIPDDLHLSPALRADLKSMIEMDPTRRPARVPARPAGDAAVVQSDATSEADSPVAGRRTGVGLLLVFSIAAAGAAYLAWSRWGNQVQPGQESRVQNVVPSATASGTPVHSAASRRTPPDPSSPPTPSAGTPAPDPEAEACRAWLAAATRGVWDREVEPALGSAAPLARRIGTSMLVADDLGLPRKELPCTQVPSAETGAWEAFVQAARQSPGAWGKSAPVSDELLNAIGASGQGLSPKARSVLRGRVESACRKALSTLSGDGMDAARAECDLASRVGVVTDCPSCARLDEHAKAVETAKTARDERCRKAQELVGECQAACTLQIDLFDPRMNDCDRACRAKHPAPGCVIEDIPP